MDYPGKVITKTQVTPTQTSASGNWTLDDQAAAIKNNNWPVALVPNPISKSLRFNSADSAYLNRTVAAAATSNTLTTLSFWFKRAKLGTSQQLFASATSAPNVACYIELTTSDTLKIYLDMTAGGSDETTWTTSAVFRDVSAWYGATIKVDTSQASNANKVLLYINGVSQTLTASQTGTAVSTQRILENGISLTIGKYFNSSGYGDFYLTEFNCIDGQALTPSSFGMTNPQTGQWIPLKYSGTYGTNGFYLNFKDATSTTTLGYDYSGNANNWTTNNFSVTAGAGNDSLTDVPTPWFAYNTTGDVGGVIRGNYATMNPVASVTTPPTFTNGNLEVTGPAAGVGATVSTFGGTSGKFYAEVTVTRTSDRLDLGIAGSLTASTFMTSTNYLGTDTNTIGYITSTGVIRKDNANNQTGLATCTTGDVVGMAIDMDSGTIQFYKNNSTVGTAVSFTPSAYGSFLIAQTTSNNTSKGTYNFGQRPFAYTPPTGFRSLCTTNLPATAIGFGLTNQGDDYFAPVLYTGTGSTQTVSTGFDTNFTWIKNRNSTNSHLLADIVRGNNKVLLSNDTAAEITDSNYTAFVSGGFSVSGNGNEINNSGASYISWNWKAGGTGVTNTAGTITSTVSANTTAGFSIVSWAATGANATIGHGLGVAPSMIIMKNRDAATNWAVYHTSITAANYLRLNSTIASTAGSTYWQNTTATSTVFYTGTANDVAFNNMIAYCFAAVPGYSAFGSYTGNGSTDGPFVYTGFRPRFVLLKSSSLAGSFWNIVDTARNSYNVINTQLYPNSSAAEGTVSVVDTLSNGFKIRTTNTDFNSNTNTYIYMAFAESPFQFSNAR